MYDKGTSGVRIPPYHCEVCVLAEFSRAAVWVELAPTSWQTTQAVSFMGLDAQVKLYARRKADTSIAVSPKHRVERH